MSDALQAYTDLFGYIYARAVVEVEALLRSPHRPYAAGDDGTGPLSDAMIRDIIEVTLFRCADTLDTLHELPAKSRPALGYYTETGELTDFIADDLGGSGEFAGYLQDGFDASAPGPATAPREFDSEDIRFPTFGAR